MATLVAERKPRARIVAEDLWAAHNASNHIPKPWLQKSIEDAERGVNVHGPFATATEAMEAMLKMADELDDDEECDLCTL